MQEEEYYRLFGTIFVQEEEYYKLVGEISVQEAVSGKTKLSWEWKHLFMRIWQK